MPADKPATIDEYITCFPPDIRETLQNLRRVVREAAPDVQEKISYGMPAFYLNGNLVYFAAHKKHIGFYPTPRGAEVLMDKLSGYKMSKGAIRFPFDKPMPYDVIAEIVRFRVNENAAE